MNNADDPHEVFHFLRWGFDITALRSLLLTTSTPPVEMVVPVEAASVLLESDPAVTAPEDRVFPLIGVGVDWDHVDDLPREALSSPLFVAPMGALGNMVIDGWHRIALARRLGMTALPGLLLTRRQAARVLLPGSAKLPPPAKMKESHP